AKRALQVIFLPLHVVGLTKLLKGTVLKDSNIEIRYSKVGNWFCFFFFGKLTPSPSRVNLQRKRDTKRVRLQPNNHQTLLRVGAMFTKSLNQFTRMAMQRKVFHPRQFHLQRNVYRPKPQHNRERRRWMMKK